MEEKEALEFHALQHFIATYNRSYDSQIRFVGLRQPPEPDALCLLNGKELGIEVTHLYGSPLDARRRLGRLQGKPPTVAEEQANQNKPLSQRVLCKLNSILYQKAKKTYSRRPVWLLIRNAFPLWTRQDFEQHVSEITVPVDHPFQHVWLLVDHDAELLQLQPSTR